jgi:molecular chaperone DnaJ
MALMVHDIRNEQPVRSIEIRKHKWPQRQTKTITQRSASRKRPRRRRFARPSAKLARKYHPTSIPTTRSAEEKFKEISEANDILSDEKKRKIYDQLGFYSDQIDPAAQAEAYARQHTLSAASSGRPPSTSAASTSPAFKKPPGAQAGAVPPHGAASKTSFPASLTASAAAAGPQPGTDLEYQATVDFWTAIRGGQARIQIQRQETCPSCHGQAHTGGPRNLPECHGTGQVTQMGGRMKFNIQCPRCNGTGNVSNDCPTCHGEGTVTRTRPSNSASSPAHATASASACRAKATPAQRRRAGDLFLIVRTGTHPVFTRTGDDIHITVPVTVPKPRSAPRSKCPPSTDARSSRFRPAPRADKNCACANAALRALPIPASAATRSSPSTS